MKYLIKNGTLINEGEQVKADILIENERIKRIDHDISDINATIIDADGLLILPGVIDDQVHFREPGLTHKAEIYTEAKAGVAGGVTSYMEMPNTVPQALTQPLLAEKYARAAEVSLGNYSFFMGTSNDNLEEVLKTDPKNVCGIKIFMGSSTGNMLVDDEKALNKLFSSVDMLIATHCEFEPSIKANTQKAIDTFGEAIPIAQHPEIRSREACYASSSSAIDLAKKHGTRLHVLHISTAEELDLFDNTIPMSEKRITSEACMHHLWFSDEDYAEKGTFIKWNPAVKKKSDREAIRQAVIDNRIDVIATDHAPHTLEEKQQPYLKAPSGGPLIQHSLVAALELVNQGVFTIDKVIEKMCHAPADMFQIDSRGYIREGYYADLVLVHPDSPWEVNKGNILAKCKWSPFEGTSFRNQVRHTFVSGHLAYSNGAFDESKKGQRLTFDR